MLGQQQRRPHPHQAGKRHERTHQAANQNLQPGMAEVLLEWLERDRRARIAGAGYVRHQYRCTDFRLAAYPCSRTSQPCSAARLIRPSVCWSRQCAIASACADAALTCRDRPSVAPLSRRRR